jgi:hypothetical protein
VDRSGSMFGVSGKGSNRGEIGVVAGLLRLPSASRTNMPPTADLRPIPGSKGPFRPLFFRLSALLRNGGRYFAAGVASDCWVRAY